MAAAPVVGFAAAARQVEARRALVLSVPVSAHQPESSQVR
jgi:hypothetical protein